jgi:hypothetical protein
VPGTQQQNIEQPVKKLTGKGKPVKKLTEGSLYGVVLHCGELFFEQPFYVLDVIEAVVNEKAQFWHHAQLVLDTISQNSPYVFGVSLNQLQHILGILAKNANIGLGNAQIGGNVNLGNCNHGTREPIPALELNYLAQVFLKQTGNSFLSVSFHGCKDKEYFDEEINREIHH